MRLPSKLYLKFIWCFFACLIATNTAIAEPAQLAGNNYVKTTLISDSQVFHPQANDSIRTARIGVKFSIQPGWHIYWQNSGDAAYPTKILWHAPEGWRVGELHWPAPTRFVEDANITTFGYMDEVLLYADLYPAAYVPNQPENINVSATVSWLVCKDKCVPGKSQLSLTNQYAQGANEDRSDAYDVFQKYESTTSQTVSSAKNNSALRHFSLEVAQVPETLRPGADASLRFSLSGLPNLPRQDLAKALQLFPYANESVSFKSGSIFAPQTDSRATEAQHGILLILPLKALATATPGTQDVAGILVFSSQLLGLDHDVSVEWSSTVKIADAGAEPPPSEELLKSGEFLPLTFRALTSHTEPIEAPAVAQSGFWSSLFLAFIAGIILNLMPCVLPIISIKVFSFVEQANQPRSDSVKSAALFAAGILSTMLALATTLIVLQHLGVKAGWGFQFQQPPFVLAVLLVVFLLSLTFFDVYTIQLPGMQGANRFAAKLTSPEAKHFFDGVLATALSTPCSAPFLGAALTYAFTQPPYITITIFLSIGTGLALPYLLIATNPRLVSLLPKPGNWMYQLRQFMGFLLLGTAVWLLFVLHHLTGEGAIWAVALLLLSYFLIWIRTWLGSGSSAGKHSALQVLSLILFATITTWYWPELTKRRSAEAVTASKLIDWKPYSPQLIASLTANHTPVFIDFTATWCITCKVNEKTAIETEKVADALKSHGYAAVKADWTDGNETVTNALRMYGGQAVPHYVILPANKDTPVVLPTLLTSGMLADALEQASKTKNAG